MSILNPSMNKMIAELVGMPPQQLAQYAAANQNDTMKFLAAKAASDMQKKQMAAGAAQQQQPAAPPVAEQVVQQMAQGLPEDSGIGALPAPNMRGYAAGGIVAFADRGLVYDPYAEQDVYSPEGVLVSGPSLDAVGASDTTLMERMGIFNRENRKAVEQIGRPKQVQPQPKPIVPGIPYTGTGVPSASAAALRGGASTQASQKAQSDQSAATRADTGAARSAPGGTTAPVQKAGESSEAMWNRIYNAMPGARANLPPEIQEAEDIRTAQAGKELASEKEAATGLAALHGKKEARIGEREKRLADKSSNDVNMALIDAGLAMMQSRGKGLAGIAEGAGVGMKRYAEDTKATEAARQKIEEARDAYDDLKFNREDMSRKQILAAEGKIADAKAATKTTVVAEIARREGVNQKTAGHIYDAEQARLLQEQTQQFQAGQNALNRQVQMATANAPSGQMQMALALGKGDAEAGMRKMTDIAAGKFNIQEAYANYMKSLGPGGMGLTPQEFAAQIRALTPQIRP